MLFRTRAGQNFVPPLYFQHQGHSRTIVGIEILKNGSVVRLLVFDPSNSRMNAMLSRGEAPARDAVKSLRKQSAAVKSRQYQIVAVCGIYASDQEAARNKVIASKRIP